MEGIAYRWKANEKGKYGPGLDPCSHTGAEFYK